MTENNIFEEGTPEIRRIEALVNEAQRYYPHKDPAKALVLFRKAIELTSVAPMSESVRKSRDLSSIGDAFWMAWVCLDLLDSPTNEIDELIVEARLKSPETAARIEERLAEANEIAAFDRESDEAYAALEQSDPHNTADAQKAVLTLASRGAWWDLRDAGIALTKKKKFDLAEQSLDTALTVAMEKAGNVPSIYVAMGDLRKAQQRHADAARHYLLSCVSAGSNPLKRAVDQLRISLKKAGVSGDTATIRDELLAMGATFDQSDVLARLNSYLSSIRGDA